MGSVWTISLVFLEERTIKGGVIIRSLGKVATLSFECLLPTAADALFVRVAPTAHLKPSVFRDADQVILYLSQAWLLCQLLGTA